MDKSIGNKKITEGIEAILACLLDQNDADYKECRHCMVVDACYFLKAAVFVCQKNQAFMKEITGETQRTRHTQRTMQ